jgi:hypothetical protein
MAQQYLSVVSKDNSSTSLLANAGVFIGIAEETTDYASIIASIFSDQAGTLVMEFSLDGGTNFDVSSSIAVVANIAKSYTIPVAGGHYRTKFTNSGGSTQTAMRLQTILSTKPPQWQDSDYIISGGLLCQIKKAKANIASGTTDGAIVAAVTGKKIRLLHYSAMTAGTATDLTFTSKPAGAGTALSALKSCGVNGGLVSGYCPAGVIPDTTVSQGLSATTSASGVATGIDVVYAEVT